MLGTPTSVRTTEIQWGGRSSKWNNYLITTEFIHRKTYSRQKMIKNIFGHAVLYWLLMIALFAPRVLLDATFNALSCLRLSFSKLPEFFQYTRSKFDRNYVRRSHFSPVQPCSHPDVHWPVTGSQVDPFPHFPHAMEQAIPYVWGGHSKVLKKRPILECLEFKKNDIITCKTHSDAK